MSTSEKPGELTDVHSTPENTDVGKDQRGPSVKMMQMVESLSAMVSVQSRDPASTIFGKMDGTHISTMLTAAENEGKRTHDREIEQGRLTAGIIVGGFLSVFALCWLFLWFKETEHLDAIIALVIGMAGGFGIGKATSSGSH